MDKRDVFYDIDKHIGFLRTELEDILMAVEDHLGGTLPVSIEGSSRQIDKIISKVDSLLSDAENLLEQAVVDLEESKDGHEDVEESRVAIEKLEDRILHRSRSSMSTAERLYMSDRLDLEKFYLKLRERFPA